MVLRERASESNLAPHPEWIQMLSFVPSLFLGPTLLPEDGVWQSELVSHIFICIWSCGQCSKGDLITSLCVTKAVDRTV